MVQHDVAARGYEVVIPGLTIAVGWHGAATATQERGRKAYILHVLERRA